MVPFIANIRREPIGAVALSGIRGLGSGLSAGVAEVVLVVEMRLALSLFWRSPAADSVHCMALPYCSAMVAVSNLLDDVHVRSSICKELVHWLSSARMAVERGVRFVNKLHRHGYTLIVETDGTIYVEFDDGTPEERSNAFHHWVRDAGRLAQLTGPIRDPLTGKSIADVLAASRSSTQTRVGTDAVPISYRATSSTDPGAQQFLSSNGPPVRRRGRSWLLRLGAEPPTAWTGCGDELGCNSDRSSPLDVYCRQHGSFLPAHALWVTPRGIAALGLIAAATFGLIRASAETRNWLPLGALYLAAGACLLVLPLRRYRVTRTAALVAWLLAAAVAAAADLLAEARSSVFAGAIAIASAFAIAHVYRVTTAGAWNGLIGDAAASEDEIIPRDVAALDPTTLQIAASIAATPILVAAWLGLTLVGRLEVRAPIWGAWLWTLPAATAAGAVVRTVLVSALLRGGKLDTTLRYHDPLRPTRPAWRLRKSSRPSPPPPAAFGLLGAFASVLGRQVNALSTLVMDAGLKIAGRSFFGITLIGWVLLRIAVRTANQLVIFARRIALAATRFVELIGSATAAAVTALARTFRCVIVPVCLISVAVGLLLFGAYENEGYLEGGGLLDAGVVVCVWAGSIAAITAAWIAWSSRRLASSVDSFAHSAGSTLGFFLIGFTIGAWIVGLPGTLGHGVVRVGRLTWAATAFLTAMLVFNWAVRKWIRPTQGASQR